MQHLLDAQHHRDSGSFSHKRHVVHVSLMTILSIQFFKCDLAETDCRHIAQSCQELTF